MCESTCMVDDNKASIAHLIFFNFMLYGWQHELIGHSLKLLIPEETVCLEK